MLEADPRPPTVSCAEAQDIATKLFGIEGRPTSLHGERDRIFKLTTSDDRAFVVKFANARESEEALRAQIDALQAIATHDPTLPVPRVHLSVRGHPLERTVLRDGATCDVRVVTFIRGTPVSQVRGTRKLRNVLGSTLARLDIALSFAGSPVVPATILWDVMRAGRLKPLLGSVADAGLMHAIANILERIEDDTRPRLARLKQQVIHNDFNSNNVLVDAEAPETITGIIDFGDILVAPRIVDPGIALARQVSADDPVGEAVEIVAGYHAVSPLDSDEVALLYDILCARLAMRLLVWSWRAKTSYIRFPEIQFAAARHLFETFLQAGRASVTSRLQAAIV